MSALERCLSLFLATAALCLLSGCLVLHSGHRSHSRVHTVKSYRGKKIHRHGHHCGHIFRDGLWVLKVLLD